MGKTFEVRHPNKAKGKKQERSAKDKNRSDKNKNFRTFNVLSELEDERHNYLKSIDEDTDEF